MRPEGKKRIKACRKGFLRLAGMLLALSVSGSDAADMICLAAEPEAGNVLQVEESGSAVQTERPVEEIKISTVQELLAVANACREDWYSYGKDFYLEADLDLTGSGFGGIAFFNGAFHGNGHKITGLWLEGKGSDAGFFRYVGPAGSVEELKVEGRIDKEGAAERVGGIAGVNFGLISGCSFQGEVNADRAVGGIAGYNKADGRILDCTSGGQITAANQTGGICGENKGIIQDCDNKSTVNGDDRKAVLNLDGVDLGQLNFTQNVVTRNDSGGIAGYSSGAISGCTNSGTVGYAHVGYNVGGIAGRHNGVIIDCENEGKILGRKDVGGIVGQAEPWMESEYLSDRLEKLQDDLGRMNGLIIQMSDAMSRTSGEASEYTRTLQRQYEDTIDSLNWEVNTLRDSISEDREETRGYIDSISQALENISEIGNDTVNRVMNDVNSTISDVNRTVNDVREEVTNRIDQVTDRLDPDKIGFPDWNPDGDGEDGGEENGSGGSSSGNENGGNGSSNGSQGGGSAGGDSTGEGENGSEGSSSGGGENGSGTDSSGGGENGSGGSSSGGENHGGDGGSGNGGSAGSSSSGDDSGSSSSDNDGGDTDSRENSSSGGESDGQDEARKSDGPVMTGAGHGGYGTQHAGLRSGEAREIPVIWRKNVMNSGGRAGEAQLIFCTSDNGGEEPEGEADENNSAGENNAAGGESNGDGGDDREESSEESRDPDMELPSVDPDRIKEEIKNAEGEIGRKDYLKRDPDPEIKNNLNRMQEEVSGISGSIRGMYDTISDTEDSVGNAAGNISNELTDQSKLSGDTIDDLADSVDGGIQSFTSSLNGLMSTQQRIRNSVGEDLDVLMGNGEALSDLSSQDVTGRTQGVVSGCVNYGYVEADLNLGGIAGAMNVEYDFSPEMDLDLTGLTDVRVRSTTYNVLIHCINYGRVTAKKNGCGGITGREDLGMIYDCENYGSLRTESGSRVGGIAGISRSSISRSYAFCNIAGTDYLGGISGDGFNISDCAAMCRIESDGGECVGSIAGHVDEDASVSGNFFTSDQWEGIDNISYYGMAMGCTYEELMTLGMPQGFSMVTITFEKGEEELGTLRIPYGGVVEEEDVPQAVSEEGYLQWDHSFPIRQVTENIVIRAEERNWLTALASEETDGRGKSLFLVEGKFHGDTALRLAECDREKEGAIRTMTWALEDHEPGPDPGQVSCIGHFLVPEGAAGAEVWILRDGDWQQVETETDGAYLTAAIRQGESFAVCPVYEDRLPLVYVACGAGALLIFLSAFLLRRKKRAGRVQKACEEPPCNQDEA